MTASSLRLLGVPPHLGRLFVEGEDSPGALQLGVGLTVGMLLATGLAGLLKAVLFNVAPGDPVTFGAIAGALLATGVAATLIPARRAARTDPIVALRER